MFVTPVLCMASQAHAPETTRGASVGLQLSAVLDEVVDQHRACAIELRRTAVQTAGVREDQRTGLAADHHFVIDQRAARLGRQEGLNIVLELNSIGETGQPIEKRQSVCAPLRDLGSCSKLTVES